MAKINQLGDVSDVNVPKPPFEPFVDIRTGNPDLDEQLSAAVWKAIKKSEDSKSPREKTS